jgi:hypothetical protein
MLLLLGAAMVKRSGELAALPFLLVLLGQAAWIERPRRRTVARLGLLGSVYALAVGTQIASLGMAEAFPYLSAVFGKARQAIATPGPAGAGAPGPLSLALEIFVHGIFRSGHFSVLAWVFLVSVVLLWPRIGREGLGWSLAALGLFFGEVAGMALWVSRSSTLDQSAVHRGLVPVAAVAAVWLAALLAPAPEVAATPPPVEPRSVRRARRRAGARA